MNSALKGGNVHVKNDLKAILTSKSFEFLMYKCTPFE